MGSCKALSIYKTINFLIYLLPNRLVLLVGRHCQKPCYDQAANCWRMARVNPYLATSEYASRKNRAKICYLVYQAFQFI